MKCQKPTCLSALKTVTSNINSIGSLYSIKSTFVSRKFLTLQQTDNLTVDISCMDYGGTCILLYESVHNLN